jgi:steroid 5-alpha reductase family enzyme
MITAFLEGWAIASALMAVLWLVQWRTKDAGVVDVGWAAGLGVLAVFHAALSGAPLARRLLVGGLAGVWAFRLAVHLLRDRVIGKPEDGRYQALRASWGARAPLYFFFFFEAQALLDAILAVPFQIALASPETPGALTDIAGASVWLVAVLGESLADRQLARFRARPESRGKTCRDGLWRYSRHPNYFFEWLHWWTYPLLAWGAPHWALTLIAPNLMLFFLLRVTGIPATEAQALKSRGDDYRAYQRTTSVFIPWFPRKESA